MQILKANETNIPAIIRIAVEAWNATYRDIITQEQIDHMLALFYNEQTLGEQIKNLRHHFRVLYVEQELAAYAHCIEDESDHKVIKLSKIYVLPGMQGKGVGKALLLHMEMAAEKLNKSVMTLNVNRKNPARFFYLKMNYQIVEEVDIPLDKFWLNDYIMQKKIGG